MSSALKRLAVTATLDAQTYEQSIMAYPGSEESKALALRFCREFEPDLMRLGFTFQPRSLGIHKVMWRGEDAHKTQDVISLFNKSGIALVTGTDPDSPYKFYASLSISLPRFGGLTNIVVAVTLDGACLVSASFSFFGL